MRIIDANVNRVVEGIRVIEDILRFEYNNKKLSKELREMRHTIRKFYNKSKLIQYRDVKNDVGVETSFESSIDRKSSYQELIYANFSRITESLRVLEEINKMGNNYSFGKEIEQIRFKIYRMESSFIKSLKLRFEKEIYGITHEKISNMMAIDQVKLFVKKGIRIIQYREKDKPKRERLEDCLKIKKYLDTLNNHIFIVNDDIDIAEIVKADGIHLGQEDIGIEYIREKYPNLIIGVSTHNKHQVKAAIEKGADYIGVGPMFATETKKNVEASKGLEFLRWVEKHTDVPYVTIGGINKNNIDKIIDSGGKTVAMISQLRSEETIDEIIEFFEGRK
jgi:thiamine-phosphate pyrophosphorylase